MKPNETASSSVPSESVHMSDWDNHRDDKVVYMIGCRNGAEMYIKIGKSVNLRHRLYQVQSSCPHLISHVFAVLSHFEEEVCGLERLFHKRLPDRLRGEWYAGSESFFIALDALLCKINEGGFSYEEILELPDIGYLPELEVMLHNHDFEFRQVMLPIRKQIPLLEGSVQINPQDLVRHFLSF